MRKGLRSADVLGGPQVLRGIAVVGNKRIGIASAGNRG
jgi:hypothetical protein